MMEVILNSAMLDWDTLFSSLRFTPKHSHSSLTLTQTNSIWLKLIHCHSTWWWQPSWIWPSWIQPSYFSLSNSLPLAKIGSHHLHKKYLHSFILTPLDDGSHLEFYYAGLKNFTHSYWIKLMMAAILNSAMLDWDTLFSSLRFTQKHSHSTLILAQTNSMWLTWWWQPSWILPSWIWPSWIQPS